MNNVSNFLTPSDLLFILGNLIFQCLIVLTLIPALIFQNILETLLSAIIKLNKRLIWILQALWNILKLRRGYSCRKPQKVSEKSFVKTSRTRERTYNFDKNENLTKSSKFETNLPNVSRVETKTCKTCICLSNLNTNNQFINCKNDIKSQFPNASKSEYYSENNIGTQTTEYKTTSTQYEEHLTPFYLYSNNLVQDKSLTEKSNNLSTSPSNRGQDASYNRCLNSTESSMLFDEINLDNCPISSDKDLESSKAICDKSENFENTKSYSISDKFYASTSAESQTMLNDLLDSPSYEINSFPKRRAFLKFSEDPLTPLLAPEEHSFFKRNWRKLKLPCFENKDSFKLKSTVDTSRISTIFGKQFTSEEKRDSVFKRNTISSEIRSHLLNISQVLKSKMSRSKSFNSVAFKRF